MKKALVIAIDGPSGAGKSSTSKVVAKRLGLAYLDTGAMYRAIAWECLNQGIDKDDTAAIVAVANDADLQISADPDDQWVYINGHEVTRAIRDPQISSWVSAVSTIAEARSAMVRRQREIIEGSTAGIIAEGRDITTVVAPDADLRILLIADPHARVARRHAELGHKVDSAAVTDQVIRRDKDDSRLVEFHEPAEGVHLIDTTNMALEEVITYICDLAQKSN